MASISGGTKEIEKMPALFIVFNIGCIECGVSSAIVGTFADKIAAETLAHDLSKTHSWREGGQNSFEVFELTPEGVIAAEYLVPPGAKERY